ncbi:MAG TPA: hypothetical protein VJP79_10390 [Nitrososphaera sp.]|nr:hypothetical protein [Nitrososphaera sp.]
MSVTMVAQWPAVSTARWIFADEGTYVTVDPWLQLPGGTVRVTGEGFAPNANVSIVVGNVIATVETQERGDSTVAVTHPDSVIAANTVTNADGTIEYALGIPRDEVKVIERWITNSTETGEEEVLKTVTTTYRFQGTVKVQVIDELGNRGSAELTVLQWIDRSPY